MVNMAEIIQLEKMLDELKEELHECDYEPERNALLKKYKELTTLLDKLKGKGI